MMNKIYIVKYCGGSYEDWYSTNIFATTKKATATKYVSKFNRILRKWKKYYSQFEEKESGIRWLKKEYAEKHFDRWHCLRFGY